MAFIDKDFDQILNEMLTDYQNQFPGIDVSQGSLVFIKSACTASAIWGLYKGMEYLARQVFPDTADAVHMEHHAWVRGLTRTENETDAALLNRLLNRIRKPPAGGNKNDYEQWALSIDNVAAAYCYPIPSGPGTVDLVILANVTNTGNEIPSDHADLTGTNTSVSELKLVDSAADFVTGEATNGDKVVNETTGREARVTTIDSATQLGLSADIFLETGQTYRVISLCEEVLAYVNSVRPVGKASEAAVIPPSILTQAVTMTVSGTGLDYVAIAASISTYMATLIPGQALYRAQLIQAALDNEGVTNVIVTTPAADVVPTAQQIIRPGVISVS